MTQEEMERLMGFILEMQAATDAKLERIAKAQAKAEARTKRFGKYVNRMVKSSRRIIIETAQSQEEIRPQHPAPAEAPNRTEENLRRLILLMERNSPKHE